MFNTKETQGMEFRVLRQRLGLSMKDVCDNTKGVTQGDLSRFETGKKDIALSTLVRLLDAMGVELTVKPKFYPPEDDD